MARQSQVYDVFLSYNTEDRMEVMSINRSLQQHGVVTWMDCEQLRPGLPWQRSLERQLPTIRSAAVFVGRNGRGPWQQIEIEAFLREFVQRGCPVIPVLLPGIKRIPRLPPIL